MNLSDLKQFGLDIPFPYKTKYENYIGGKWVAPAKGEYFENVSPITGKPFCQVARSSADDIELALDAAHAVRRQWGPAHPRPNALICCCASRIAWKKISICSPWRRPLTTASPYARRKMP